MKFHRKTKFDLSIAGCPFNSKKLKMLPKYQTLPKQIKYQKHMITFEYSSSYLAKFLKAFELFLSKTLDKRRNILLMRFSYKTTETTSNAGQNLKKINKNS